MIIRIDKYFISALKDVGIDSKFLVRLYKESRIEKMKAEGGEKNGIQRN